MKPLVLAWTALSLAAPAAASPDPTFDAGAPPPALESAAPPSAGHRVESGDRRRWVVVDAGDKFARTAVASAGVSIEEVSSGKVGGIASPAAVGRLRALGLRFTQQELAQRFRPEDFPAEDSVYHSYDRVASDLQAMAAAAPGLASVISIGKSVQGRDLWALRLNTSASGAAPSAKPGLLLLGTHHAREHLSTEVPLLIAKHIVEHRNDAALRELLAKRDVWVVPLVNPDGAEQDVRGGSYHMHRKNMRPLSGDDVGVDLNRNYGYHWGEAGASADPSADTYRGPGAFSEPETQAVKAFVDARPNLKMLVTYHTFSEMILYPWSYGYDAIPDGRALAAYKAMGAEMAKMTGYTSQQSSALYASSGDTGDWAWAEHGIFSFTFELTPKTMWDGGFYPGAAAVGPAVKANIPPALYLLELTDDPYRAGAPRLTSNAVAPAGGR